VREARPATLSCTLTEIIRRLRADFASSASNSSFNSEANSSQGYQRFSCFEDRSAETIWNDDEWPSPNSDQKRLVTAQIVRVIDEAEILQDVL